MSQLILVVGPSGVGKDSLLQGAISQLPSDAFMVATREITRAPDPKREHFISVTPEEFEQRKAAGRYALWWGRYKSQYGVPKTIDDELAAGRSVLVNVSKEVIATARSLYPDVRVLWIQAPIDVIEKRLRSRNTDTEEEIQERLAYARTYSVPEPFTPVDNKGGLEEGIAAFLAAIRG